MAFLLTALLSENEPSLSLSPFFLSGLQVPGGLVLVQHGEDDLRGDAPRILTHIKVRHLSS